MLLIYSRRDHTINMLGNYLRCHILRNVVGVVLRDDYMNLFGPNVNTRKKDHNIAMIAFNEENTH